MKVNSIQSPFLALAKSIVYQQLTGKAAATIFGRLCERVGKGRRFTPEVVLAHPVESLCEAGLSGARTAALRDLSAKALEGEVPTLARAKRMSDAELVGHLTKVRGIGRWTVEMLLMFRLGRPDVLPVDDYGVSARASCARTASKRCRAPDLVHIWSDKNQFGPRRRYAPPR